MRKLKGLKITEVSFCKKGMNPDAKIVLMKSDPSAGQLMDEDILTTLAEIAPYMLAKHPDPRDGRERQDCKADP